MPLAMSKQAHLAGAPSYYYVTSSQVSHSCPERLGVSPAEPIPCRQSPQRRQHCTTLNTVADLDGNPSTSTNFDAVIFLRVFTNDA